MPIIKLTAEGKVITKSGLPSCSCCGQGLCSAFNLDMLLSSFPPDGYTFEEEGELFEEGLATLTGYKRKEACFRWLCREVVVSGGVIVSESNTAFGGPTENAKDLWIDICRPLFGDETRSGNFFYRIDFRGWEQLGAKPRIWISEDDQYYVTKYFIT